MNLCERNGFHVVSQLEADTGIHILHVSFWAGKWRWVKVSTLHLRKHHHGLRISFPNVSHGLQGYMMDNSALHQLHSNQTVCFLVDPFGSNVFGIRRQWKSHENHEIHGNTTHTQPIQDCPEAGYKMSAPQVNSSIMTVRQWSSISRPPV